MAEDTGTSADPSMEEILASIRKIISDDTPPAEAQAPEPELPSPVTPEVMEKEDDVLELTQMVQDDGSVVDLKEEVPPPPALPPVAPPPAPRSADALISEPAAKTAASALSSLANTVEVERLSSIPMTATFLGNGARTLEDMVIELMRPMLQQWLDTNLPPIVERLVQKEIERIARRS